MRTQRKLYLVLPVVTFVLVVALFSGFTPIRAQEQENTLTIAISGDVETLDPPFSRFQRSNEINYNVYDQFFRYGWRDSGKGYNETAVDVIEGGSVESWDWSEDKLSIVLHIRQGVI